MRKFLFVLALAMLTAGLASPALALNPEDAVYLTKEGVEDQVIIAKICADAEGWDLTAEEIAYLRDQGVSREVVEALIDPAGAAERYGFTLGNPEASPESYPDNYASGTSSTSLVFSFGYYYGPLGVHYFNDPYFYSYYCSPYWGFSYSYWPYYYRTNYFPYHYGYYAYPYYAYTGGSYYCGYPYYGSAYPKYCAAPLPASYTGYVNEPVRWREGADLQPTAAYRSGKPNMPETRYEGSGRTLLDGQKRGEARSVDVIRGGGDQVTRGKEAVGGKDRSVASRGGTARGTAAEKYLASRSVTKGGRATSGDASKTPDRAKVIRPGSRDGVESVGRGRVETPRTGTRSPEKLGTPSRGDASRSVRAPRSGSTPRTIGGPSRGISRSGTRGTVSTPRSVPSWRTDGRGSSRQQIGTAPTRGSSRQGVQRPSTGGSSRSAIKSAPTGGSSRGGSVSAPRSGGSSRGSGMSAGRSGSSGGATRSSGGGGRSSGGGGRSGGGGGRGR